MKKVKTCLVKPVSVREISPRAYVFECFDGSSDIIPTSQIYGMHILGKTDGYWIPEWLLKKKKLQYSTKKVLWYDQDTGKPLMNVSVKTHVPKKEDVKETQPHHELVK